jgi:ankyrin repeat protein
MFSNLDFKPMSEGDKRLPPIEQRFPNARYNSELMIESQSTGNINKMINLIKNGAIVNHKGNGDMTALHYAAFANDPDKIKLLLDNGADKNIKDKNNETALELAIKHNKENSIGVLETYVPNPRVGGARRNKSNKSKKSRKSKKSKKSKKSRKSRKSRK